MVDSDLLISIITPVYNAEKYLSKCIESILNQSHKNIELILVDDGSPDASGKICDTYAEKDARVKVIHKQNQGQGIARNKALDVATGDYVMFVDSDDWVEPDFCETALNAALKNEADIVCFGYNTVTEEGEITSKVFTRNPRTIGVSDGIKDLILRTDVIYNYPCNKLFSRKTTESVRFPEEYLHFEDQGFIYLTFHHAKKIYLDDHVLYNYLQRSNSSSHGTNGMGHDWDRPPALKSTFEIWQQRLAFIKEHYPELEDAQMKQLADVSFRGVRLLSNNKDYDDVRKAMLQFLKQHKQEVLRLMPKKAMLFYYCRPLFFLYYRFFK